MSPDDFILSLESNTTRSASATIYLIVLCACLPVNIVTSICSRTSKKPIEESLDNTAQVPIIYAWCKKQTRRFLSSTKGLAEGLRWKSVRTHMLGVAVCVWGAAAYVAVESYVRKRHMRLDVLNRQATARSGVLREHRVFYVHCAGVPESSTRVLCKTGRKAANYRCQHLNWRFYVERQA